MAWVATAIIGGSVVSGMMASDAQTSAAQTAAGAQTQASEASIAETRRQFDIVQKLLEPYVGAGTSARTVPRRTRYTHSFSSGPTA